MDSLVVMANPHSSDAMARTVESEDNIANCLAITGALPRQPGKTRSSI